MKFTAIYYEPDTLDYFLGKRLKEEFRDLPWFPIESHNRIPEMTARENKDFPELKSYLILGTRKTHKYVENQKISDYLVPFTSSGCTAMCLYCYLVCNYNKCSYLRLFVNREQMLDRLIRFSKKSTEPLTYEIGSNSDLVLENTITRNLEWVIPEFAARGRGHITFPSKFDTVDSLLTLNHQSKTIFRMSVNPQKIISTIEFGTSPLLQRLEAVNKMTEAGYPCGILIAPLILIEDWEQHYAQLIELLAQKLTAKAKKSLTVEVIFMTYSYIHRAINAEAFPNAVQLYNPAQMSGRGRGKYCYRQEIRQPAEQFILAQLKQKLPEAHLEYIS